MRTLMYSSMNLRFVHMSLQTLGVCKNYCISFKGIMAGLYSGLQQNCFEKLSLLGIDDNDAV